MARKSGVTHLDAVSVAAACQAISSETSIDTLVALAVRLAIESSGALTASLLLAEKGELQLAAYGAAEEGKASVQVLHTLPSPDTLPLTLIRHVKESRQKVVLNDCGAPHTFSDDPHLLKSPPRSLACFPIAWDGRVHGALYLENHQHTDAFDIDRTFLLETIATHTGIAMENLVATEEFRGLFHSAPDAMVIVDDTGSIVMTNGQLERLFGYSQEELIGQPMAMLIPERYRKEHVGHFERYREAPRFRGMGEGGELRGLRKDGTEFPVDISLSPFTIDSSLLITAAIRDVTERKREEDALRVAEAKYRGIFENSVDGIFCASPCGKLLEVNTALAKMLGYPAPADLMADAAAVLRGARLTGEKVAEARRELEAGRSRIVEAEVGCRDGSRITVSIRAAAVFDDTGVLHYQGIVENITERKRAEEALRFSEARYRALFHDNPTMIFTVNEALTVVSVNPFAARQLGYLPEELEGRNIVAFFHPDDRIRVTEQLLLCLMNPTVVYTWQFRKIRKGGSTVWVEELGQAVYDLNGRLNVLVVCLDTTDRLLAEMALRESELKYRQLSEQLEARVEETVAELRQKDKLLAIQGRQAVMGEMISNIAHQWRQPLNTLALLAQEMHYYYIPEHGRNEGADKNFARTMDIINHMSKTIDDFRNFFRPEKEKLPFRLSESIEKSLNLLEGSLKNMRIKVEVRQSADPELVGFPTEFSQVLVNILINARDAFLTNHTPDPTVTIEVFQDDCKMVVTITDNAGGISPSVLEKVFDPYFTTKGPDQGTGVGLFMCKTIIEKSMNGKLSVRNVNGGAQFRIEL